MTNKTNTGDYNTGYSNAGDYNTGSYNAGDSNAGNYNTGDYNAGNYNAGDRNTGNYNAGNRNTGSYNTGYSNAGNYNTGDYNAGDNNAGDRNAGNYNAGDRNTGHRNTGHGNTGYYNTGDYNTGNYNTGNYNTGYLNSITPEDCLIFNKPAKRADWVGAQKPQWMLVRLTRWISDSNMTNKEKDVFPSYVTTGGYLKCYSSLKAAYIEAWDKTTQEDRDLTRKLPNFDENVFEEVFGFNPWKKSCNGKIVEIDGIKYKLSEV